MNAGIHPNLNPNVDLAFAQGEVGAEKAASNTENELFFDMVNEHHRQMVAWHASAVSNAAAEKDPVQSRKMR